jgi:hypothetical protein
MRFVGADIPDYQPIEWQENFITGSGLVGDVQSEGNPPRLVDLSIRGLDAEDCQTGASPESDNRSGAIEGLWGSDNP